MRASWRLPTATTTSASEKTFRKLSRWNVKHWWLYRENWGRRATVLNCVLTSSLLRTRCIPTSLQRPIHETQQTWQAASHGPRCSKTRGESPAKRSLLGRRRCQKRSSWSHPWSTTNSAVRTATWITTGLFKLPAAIFPVSSFASSAEHKCHTPRPGPRRQQPHRPGDRPRQLASWTGTAARCRSSSGGKGERHATLHTSAVRDRHRNRWQTDRR